MHFQLSTFNFQPRKWCLPAVLLVAMMPVYAQVTIGSGNPPERAALLDLKTQTPDGDNVTSDQGGFVLPRVKLVDPETFEPFILTTDAGWQSPTSRDELKRLHTGLQVYNLTANNDFKPGIYFWDGSRWKAVTPDDPSLIAFNGLSKNGNELLLGGTLSQATTLTSGAHNLLLNAQGAGKVSIGSTPVSPSALLEVNTTNKGFLLPRVALASNTDALTIPAPATGLIAYNTATNATITPGLVSWDGTRWLKMVTEIPKVEGSTVQRANLIPSSLSTLVGSQDGSGGVLLNFGPLTIPEDGSYAFSFRLYGFAMGDGTAGATVNMRKSAYFFSLWSGATLKDIAEIDLVVYTESELSQTYTIVMAGSFSKGDTPTFKLSHYYEGEKAWRLIGGTDMAANRTSMVWWKL
jgi:hypothetical protein